MSWSEKVTETLSKDRAKNKGRALDRVDGEKPDAPLAFVICSAIRSEERKGKMQTVVLCSLALPPLFSLLLYANLRCAWRRKSPSYNGPSNGPLSLAGGWFGDNESTLWAMRQFGRRHLVYVSLTLFLSLSLSPCKDRREWLTGARVKSVSKILTGTFLLVHILSSTWKSEQWN